MLNKQQQQQLSTLQNSTTFGFFLHSFMVCVKNPGILGFLTAHAYKKKNQSTYVSKKQSSAYIITTTTTTTKTSCF